MGPKRRKSFLNNNTDPIQFNSTNGFWNGKVGFDRDSEHRAMTRPINELVTYFHYHKKHKTNRKSLLKLQKIKKNSSIKKILLSTKIRSNADFFESSMINSNTQRPIKFSHAQHTVLFIYLFFFSSHF